MAARRKTARPRKTAIRKQPHHTCEIITQALVATRHPGKPMRSILKRGVFKLTSARKIAASLKRSAEHSSRRKAGACIAPRCRC